jgi:FMN-dependent NADH-azoreductase
MWNGGIPYRLKHYIDVVHQPRITFGIDGNGYFGLLKDKHATLVMTSGAYADDRPSPAWGVDHQSTYMRAWLNQAGVTKIDEIQYRASARNADPTNGLEKAIRQAEKMATAVALT